MLEEETEMWVESVWESMSEQLRRLVVAAVDTGLMDARKPDDIPEAVLHSPSGAVLDEADDLSREDGVFEEIMLGKHDIRSGDSSGRSFRLKDPLRTYVLVRVLL
jgi:hypothetical protein